MGNEGGREVVILLKFSYILRSLERSSIKTLMSSSFSISRGRLKTVREHEMKEKKRWAKVWMEWSIPPHFCWSPFYAPFHFDSCLYDTVCKFFQLSSRISFNADYCKLNSRSLMRLILEYSDSPSLSLFLQQLRMGSIYQPLRIHFSSFPTISLSSASEQLSQFLNLILTSVLSNLSSFGIETKVVI